MKQKTKCFRNLNGVLLLDKPLGITSNYALQRVKHIYMARKAGHTGSLDPLASGMLPICFGEATKFARFLLDTDKYYRVTMKLGIKTETGDAEGKIIAESKPKNFSFGTIESILKNFLGPIEQIPSMYSAIKYHGKPLYKLAREGAVVEREKRIVNIYSLELLRYENDELELNVHSSKGTYIRTLVEDIGDKMGCGAHVSALRRLRVGHYREEQMITMENLEKLQSKDVEESLQNTALINSMSSKCEGYILPIESMFNGLSSVNISEAIAYYLRQGQPVTVPHAPTSGLVKINMKDGRFLGVGEILDDGMVAPRRLISVFG